LFEAKFNREDVIVKFCRFHYAYSYLAGHQLAPQLKYNMEILPSKWLIVVMEKIQGSHLQIPVSEEGRWCYGMMKGMCMRIYVSKTSLWSIR